MSKSKPQQQSAPDASRLTDEECDFIIWKVLQSVTNTVNPIDFFRGMGRGVVFEVRDEERDRVRNLIRLIAHGE